MSPETQIDAGLAEASAEFQVTDWFSVTDRAKVVHQYLYPLKVYLVGLLTRFPDYRDEAEDLLQDFVTDRILQPGWLEKADPKKGRFRDFLKSSLRNSVLGEIRRREAAKRGGKHSPIPLEDLDQELAGPEPLSDSFDLAWLQMVLAQTLEQMERSCTACENGHIWEIFRLRILGPALEGSPAPPYEDLVARFGFKSPTQATNALTTGKRMFARHLRAVVAQYEAGDLAVRTEIQTLRLFLDKMLPARSKEKP